MNCPNCGRELAEGEICTCTQVQAQPIQQVAYAQQVVAAPVEPKLPPSTDYPEGYKIKKKYVAVILGFLLGGYGAHNFYLGNKTNAIIQIVLSTAGIIFFGLGPIAASIWALIETIMILAEAKEGDGNNYKIMTLEESIAKSMKESQKD